MAHRAGNQSIWRACDLNGGMLTMDDQLTCLTHIRRHLVRGGKLILDLFNPDLLFLTSDVIG